MSLTTKMLHKKKNDALSHRDETDSRNLQTKQGRRAANNPRDRMVTASEMSQGRRRDSGARTDVEKTPPPSPGPLAPRRRVRGTPRDPVPSETVTPRMERPVLRAPSEPAAGTFHFQFRIGLGREGEKEPLVSGRESVLAGAGDRERRAE